MIIKKDADERIQLDLISKNIIMKYIYNIIILFCNSFKKNNIKYLKNCTTF